MRRGEPEGTCFLHVLREGQKLPKNNVTEALKLHIVHPLKRSDAKYDNIFTIKINGLFMLATQAGG